MQYYVILVWFVTAFLVFLTLQHKQRIEQRIRKAALGPEHLIHKQDSGLHKFYAGLAVLLLFVLSAATFDADYDQLLLFMLLAASIMTGKYFSSFQVPRRIYVKEDSLYIASSDVDPISFESVLDFKQSKNTLTVVHAGPGKRAKAEALLDTLDRQTAAYHNNKPTNTMQVVRIFGRLPKNLRATMHKYQLHIHHTKIKNLDAKTRESLYELLGTKTTTTEKTIPKITKYDLPIIKR